MTPGPKGNLTMITLEASLKSELQNQFSFLLLPQHALPWNLTVKETFPYDFGTLLRLQCDTGGCYGVGVEGECHEKLTINRNSQKITCGREQMRRYYNRRQALHTAAGEQKGCISQMNYKKKMKLHSREVLTSSSHH